MKKLLALTLFFFVVYADAGRLIIEPRDNCKQIIEDTDFKMLNEKLKYYSLENLLKHFFRSRKQNPTKEFNSLRYFVHVTIRDQQHVDKWSTKKVTQFLEKSKKYENLLTIIKNYEPQDE